MESATTARWSDSTDASAGNSLAGDVVAIILAMALLMGAFALVPDTWTDSPFIDHLWLSRHRDSADPEPTDDRLPGEAEGPAEAANDPQADAAGPIGDVNVTLVNTGNRPIIEIRIASSADRAWGPDVLGDGVVAEGASFNLKPDAAKGCRFDLLVRFDGGASEERHDLDFCTLSELTVPR